MGQFDNDEYVSNVVFFLRPTLGILELWHLEKDSETQKMDHDYDLIWENVTTFMSLFWRMMSNVIPKGKKAAKRIPEMWEVPNSTVSEQFHTNMRGLRDVCEGSQSSRSS